MKAMNKQRPPEGWPDPEDEKQGQDDERKEKDQPDEWSGWPLYRDTD